MFLSFGNRLKLTFIAPDSLLLEHPRWLAFLDLLGLLGTGALVGFLLFNGQSPDSANWLGRLLASSSQCLMFILFLVLLLVVVSQTVIRDLRVLVKGSQVLLDGATRRILVNRRQVATFHDVGCVRITKIIGVRSPSHYELCVDLKGARWLEIDTHGSPAEYVIAANAIANILHACIEQNER